MKKSGLYSRLWYAYLLIYIIYFALQEILPTRNFMHDYLPHSYTLVGVLGVALLAVDFFTRRRMFRLPGTDMLMLFFVITMISIVVNYRYDFTGNIKGIMWMAIQIFLLIALPPETPKKTHIKRLSVVFDVFIFIWLVAVLWALGMYLAQEGGSIETIRTDRVQSLPIGFMNGRLHGMFEDPNYAAVAAFFSIGFSVFCMCWGEHPKGFKIYYIIAIVMFVFYIILSGSRTVKLVAVIVSFFAAGFCAVLRVERKFFLRALAFLLAGAVGASVVWGSWQVLQKGLSYLPGVREIIVYRQQESEPQSAEITETPEATAPLVKAVDFTREDVAYNEDVSNNRFAIWSDYIQVFLDTPLFGASPRGSFLYAQDHFEDLFIFNRPYKTTHNGYLMLLVSVGILGSIWMLIWFVKVFFEVLGYLLRHINNRTDSYWMILLSSVMLMAFAMYSVLYSMMFFSNLVIDVLFWLIIGVTLYLIRESEPERYTKVSVTARIFDAFFVKIGCAKRANSENVL